MNALIIAIQIMCVAGLAFGTVLSIFQMKRTSPDMQGFDFAAANDFETGFRRMARNRP
jgi:hypothetical protein